MAWAFFFSFFPVFLGRDGIWLSCRTGKVGGSSLGPVGLEARLPLSSTVPFFPVPLLGMRSCSFSVEIPLFEEPGLGFTPIW